MAARNYRAAGREHGGFRLAILPIGAYEPRWFMEAQHQNPEEAVEGMLLCKAAFAVGHHWGTFQLTDEAIDEPRERLSGRARRARIARERFRRMLPGEVWDVPERAGSRDALAHSERQPMARCGPSARFARRRTAMIKWILILLIVAAVASLLGMPALAGAAATGARILIGIVLVLFLLDRARRFRPDVSAAAPARTGNSWPFRPYSAELDRDFRTAWPAQRLSPR